ncbi:MAG: hypothetical protein AAGB10_22390 [Pseudomonadota bacterium]
MVATQSDLSDPRYGYDLVAGTTQASINATMKEFLSKFQAVECIKCYAYVSGTNGGQGSFEELDFETLKSFVGKDPFSITDKDADAEALKKLYEKKFVFGFKAKLGLPTEFELADIPDVVVLDRGNHKVTYNLTAKDFKLIAMEEHFGDLSWTNIAQADQAKPWTFRFEVDLDLASNDAAFNDLPEDVQQHVKNLEPGSMFSVQQLYLDLNTPGLEAAPDIPGLDKSSTAYLYLTRFFLNTYFEALQDRNRTGGNPQGNYLLGYAIKPSNVRQRNSIVPTDLNFMVSPFLDETGNATKHYPLYTLNWLVMTEDHPMVPAKPFGWNWVQEADVSNFHGAMAIKRGVFAEFLSGLLSPSLTSICLVPSAKIDANWKGLTVKLSISKDRSPGSFKPVTKPGAHVLTFSHHKSDKDDVWKGIYWGNIEVKTNVTSDVYFEGKTIRVVTTAGAWMHFNAEGGVSEGDIVKYRVTTRFNLGVDANGQLAVSMADPAFEDLSNFDTSFWAKVISLGQINQFIANIKGFLDVMHRFLSDRPNRVKAMLNGSRSWVFPGGQTFLFKDPQFSSKQDLVAHVTYAAPTKLTLSG